MLTMLWNVLRKFRNNRTHYQIVEVETNKTKKKSEDHKQSTCTKLGKRGFN